MNLRELLQDCIHKKMFSFSMDLKVPGKERCGSEYNNYKDNIVR